MDDKLHRFHLLVQRYTPATKLRLGGTDLVGDEKKELGKERLVLQAWLEGLRETKDSRCLTEKWTIVRHFSCQLASGMFTCILSPHFFVGTIIENSKHYIIPKQCSDFGHPHVNLLEKIKNWLLKYFKDRILLFKHRKCYTLQAYRKNKEADLFGLNNKQKVNL